MNKIHPPLAFSEALHGHRRELDALDAQLVALLAARFSITAKIGELKAQYRVPAEDRTREQAQLERIVLQSVACGLPPQAAQTVFETLFGLVRENHRAQATGGDAPL